MCRNIRTLFNFDPPATDEEIYQASLQFVRKISGYTKPSKINEEAFNNAVNIVSNDIRKLLATFKTDAKPHDRKVEAARAHARAVSRFGTKDNR